MRVHPLRLCGCSTHAGLAFAVAFAVAFAACGARFFARAFFFITCLKEKMETPKLCKDCIHFSLPGTSVPVCRRLECMDMIYGNQITCRSARKKSGPCRPAGLLFGAFPNIRQPGSK